MNIIDAINHKVKSLANIGLTDESKVHTALVESVMTNKNRNPNTILSQQCALMTMNFYGGDTQYVKGA